MWILIPIPASPRFPALPFSSPPTPTPTPSHPVSPSSVSVASPQSQPNPRPPHQSPSSQPPSPTTSSILDSPSSTIYHLHDYDHDHESKHEPEHTHAQQISQTSKPSLGAPGAVSGTESDSDSILTPDASAHPTPSFLLAGSSSHPQQPPLSSIAERRSGGDEEAESEDEEEEEEDDLGASGWRTPDHRTTGVRRGGEGEERILKSGYLWKKGERRKTWKKRWFVLRPAHLAYYKTSAEYQLLRLLDLSDIHSCVPVSLKRHSHTFGLVTVTSAPASHIAFTPSTGLKSTGLKGGKGSKEKDRTYLFEAADGRDRDEWVEAIEEARRVGERSVGDEEGGGVPISLPLGTPGVGVAAPIPIVRSTSDQRSAHAIQIQGQGQPASVGRAQGHGMAGLSLSSSPGQPNVITSSDSEDGGTGSQFVPPYMQQQGAPSPTAVTFSFPSPPALKTPSGAPVAGSSSGYVSSGGGGYVSGGERSGGAPGKVVLSGYLMKCGKQRRTWRKRWFVLTEEKLVYSGSHMDTKPHRIFPFSEILDALEYELPSHSSKHKSDHHGHGHPHIPSSITSNLPSSLTSKSPHRDHPTSSSRSPQPNATASGHRPPITPSTSAAPGLGGAGGSAGAALELMPSAEDGGAGTSHTFKIVTTKRNLLLCAPSEDDEIKWLGAIRALIARRSGMGVLAPGAKGRGGAVAGAVGVIAGVSGVVGAGSVPGSVVPVDVTLSGSPPRGVAVGGGGAGRKPRRMSHGASGGSDVGV